MAISIIISAVVLLSGIAPVCATELDPVVVTANRTAQTADETLAPVTVITRTDIEKKQGQSVQDVLRGLPGVNITNNGGAGKASSIFLRGTESDHALVLINGVKAGSATLGITPFQLVPIEHIERIEVVRGPRSSLYGSEAIGGVIQIFTRRGGGETRPFFSLGGGSHDTYNASAGISGGGDRGWFSVSAQGINTDGINACRGSLSAGCFTIEPDKDPYKSRSRALRVGYHFENGVEVDAHALRAESENDFDGALQNESESVLQILGGQLRISPFKPWQITLSGGRSWDESDNFKDGNFQSRFNTERDTVSLQNDLSFGGHNLFTLGVDYQDDRVSGTTDYAESSRDNWGVFAQYQGTFDAHDLQLSIRRDDNQQFGEHITGAAAWGYTFSNNLRLTASFGTAFKGPTFNELYFPVFGNPDLDPEESNSLEFGLSGPVGRGRWSLSAYETRIDDLIAFDADTMAPANIDEARIRGLEATVAAPLMGWDMAANLTLLDPEDRSSGANRGNRLARRAEQSFRLDVDRQLDQFLVGATILAEGRRFDDLANTRRLGGYTTIDLRAEYLIAKDWRLQARVENLFDKDYETAAFYNQPGRSLYVTLRYEP